MVSKGPDSPPKKGKNHGRSKWSQEIEDAVVEDVSKGTPLTVACRKQGICSRTFNRWRKDDDDLASRVLRARDLGFDAIADECMRIADTPMEGTETIDTPDGPRIKTADMLGHRKLQIETRLKLLACWDPRRYGNKVKQEISGPDGQPIQTQSIGEAVEAKVEEIADRRSKLESPRK